MFINLNFILYNCDDRLYFYVYVYFIIEVFFNLLFDNDKNVFF